MSEIPWNSLHFLNIKKFIKSGNKSEILSVKNNSRLGPGQSIFPIINLLINPCPLNLTQSYQKLIRIIEPFGMVSAKKQYDQTFFDGPMWSE